VESAGLTIRILLADEQSLFRQAMRAVLESEPDLEVVGEAGDGLSAIAEADALRPDVVLIGARLPRCDGIRATMRIKERVPECQILVLSPEDDPEAMLDAIEAGAAAFVTKTQPLTDLVSATRSARRGATLLPSRLLGPLIRGLRQRVHAHDRALRRLSRLSNRELEVLALLTQGSDNDGIASRLVISPETARTHVQNVLAKLGVHSRLEAAAFVATNGLRDECWTDVQTLAGSDGSDVIDLTRAGGEGALAAAPSAQATRGPA
jgi:DNA-binding NarL/FixJ family response regulator